LRICASDISRRSNIQNHAFGAQPGIRGEGTSASMTARGHVNFGNDAPPLSNADPLSAKQFIFGPLFGRLC
jgi:hypothetical protein